MDWGYRMSSFERSRPVSAGLRKTGLVSELSPVEPRPYPENRTFPFIPAREFDPTAGSVTPDPDALPDTEPLEDQGTASHMTRVLTFNDSPRVTRLLADFTPQTGALYSTGNTTTSLRQPVVIRGTGQRPRSLKHVPRSRRGVVISSVIAALAVLLALTGLAVAPLASGNSSILSGLFSSSGSIHSSNDALINQDLIAQAATQTALQHTDGYGGISSTGGQTFVGAGVTPDRFAFGNCTYWADLEYHNLTGYWVQWTGNADQWAYGAQQAGWIVSSQPHVYSIIVLQPGVEGAGWLGHVAVVMSINPDGSVVTSNMNWYSNGGWDIVSTVVFYPGPGVSFVWHP
jgi:surface antigen